VRFRPHNRLRKPKEFQDLFQKGKRINLRAFTAIWCYKEPKEADQSRLGLIVSKKVGNAVKRNRTKRILREAFRATALLHVRPIDLVIIARADCAQLSSQTVTNLLTRVFTLKR
jgi:ribonuclease P protein component